MERAKLYGVILATSTIVSATFSPDIWKYLGVQESYQGELQAYLPLFRVFATFITIGYFIDSKSLQAFFMGLQTLFSLALNNISLVSKLFGADIQIESKLGNLLEMIPFLLVIVIILKNEENNAPTSWEPEFEKLKEVRRNIVSKMPELESFDEVKKKIKEKIDSQEMLEKLEEVGKKLKQNVIDTEIAMKERVKMAEKYIEEHYDEIEEKLVPENLKEEIFPEYEDSSDSAGEETPKAKKRDSDVVASAKQRALEEIQLRSNKRVEELRQRKSKTISSTSVGMEDN